MSRQMRLVLVALLVTASALAVVSAPTNAQENPPPKPVTIDCATNVSSQVFGATPVGDGSQTLVQARIIFGPGGIIGSHTHPGTLVVTVESGSLGFTLLEEGEMVVNRAATADTEAAAEPMVQGEEVAVEPGDGFVETGMVHIGVNLADGTTTVLLAGLITTGEPLTQCVEAPSTPTGMNHT